MPPVVTDAVERATAAIRQELPASSWAPPGAMHVTYAFPGEHEEHAVDSIAAHVQKHLAAIEQFDCAVRDCGFFPDERRPRVAWLGLTPAEPLVAVAAAVRAGLHDAAVAFDEKPFRVHLTVARTKNAWREKDAQLFRSAFGGFESAPFALTHVSLYSSHLSPGGAIHNELVRFELRRHTDTV